MVPAARLQPRREETFFCILEVFSRLPGLRYVLTASPFGHRRTSLRPGSRDLDSPEGAK